MGSTPTVRNKIQAGGSDHAFSFRQAEEKHFVIALSQFACECRHRVKMPRY